MSSSDFLVLAVFSNKSHCEIFFFFPPMQTHFDWFPDTRVAVLFKVTFQSSSHLCVSQLGTCGLV